MLKNSEANVYLEAIVDLVNSSWTYYICCTVEHLILIWAKTLCFGPNNRSFESKTVLESHSKKWK